MVQKQRTSSNYQGILWNQPYIYNGEVNYLLENQNKNSHFPNMVVQSTNNPDNNMWNHQPQMTQSNAFNVDNFTSYANLYSQQNNLNEFSRTTNNRYEASPGFYNPLYFNQSVLTPRTTSNYVNNQQLVRENNNYAVNQNLISFESDRISQGCYNHSSIHLNPITRPPNMYVQPVMTSNKSIVNQSFVPKIEFKSNIDVSTTVGPNQPVCKWMIGGTSSVNGEIELEQSHRCNRSFSTIGELIDHLDNDHIKEIHHRTCQWENCTDDKTHKFQNRRDLFRHLKTKAGLRFRCEYEECSGTTFTLKSSLQRHVKSKHRN